MKKILLSIVLTALTAVGASAFSLQKAPFTVNGTMDQSAMPAKGVSLKGHQATENGFILQFSDDVDTWTYAAQQAKITYRCYVYVPAEITKEIAGNKITAIRFSTVTDYSTSPRKGSVFVAEEMNTDVTGPYSASGSCTIVDCYSQGQQTGVYYQEVALDEPYTIKEGQAFFFGYIVENCRYSAATKKLDWPIGIDYMDANAYAGFVDVFNYASKNDYMGSLDMAEDAGTNLYVAAVTEGDSHGFSNYFVMGSPSMGDFTLPVFVDDAQPVLLVPFKNMGSNALKSIDYTLMVNGEDAGSYSQSINILPGQQQVVSLEIPELTVGRNNIDVVITKVNDKDMMQSTSTGCIVLDNNGYDRKFVVEEFTGTWCGYCPMGIVGMEKMAETYPDSFIGIAVHSGDAMEVDSYAGIINTFANGYPSCVVNRDPIYAAYPSFEQLETIKNNYWGDERAIASVTATGSLNDDEDELNVNVTTTFALSEDNANYRLAVVVLENGIIGKQNNNFAGYPNELEWWGDQGSSVSWSYSDTARDIFDTFGLPGSVPTTVKKAEPVKYSYTASLENVEDVEEMFAVVLLLDVRTGTILNAARVEIVESGVDSPVANVDANAPAEYFNLQGIRVENPTSGLYIRRQGNAVAKVLVK